MAKRGDFDTLAHGVYQQLRADILRGELAPGERLKPAELGGRFQVSVGVVREALTKLTSQHLVFGERNRGFQVVPLSMDDLQQLTEARKINEGTALRLAVDRGDVEWESRVLSAHHLMAKTPIYPYDDPDHSNDEFSVAHEQFHFALLAGCENDYLLDACRRLFDASEMYRRWSTSGGKKRNVASEHRKILEAALARKTEEAVELYCQHIDRTATATVHRLEGSQA
jgi:DNA-binding GntR family transcriptional regulator